MKKNLFWLLVLLLLKPGLALSSGTVTEWSHDLPADYRRSNILFDNHPGSLFGPRIAWAEPYALGKLKLLIILPAYTAFEAVELRSRIPAEVELITMAAHDKWLEIVDDATYNPVPPQGLLDTAQRLLSPGYRYDAIIIGKVRWSVIPLEIRSKIVEKVKGGTALVWISPWDVEEDLRKQLALSEPDNPLSRTIRASVPGILPLDVDFEKTSPKHFAARRMGPPEIRVGKLGGGNVVWLDYQDRMMKDNRQTVHQADPWLNYVSGIALTPFLKDDDLYYDYYFSILGKALYYAAGKAAGMQVRAQQPVVTIAQEQLPSAPVSFTVSLANQGLRDWSLAYELRDRHNRVIQKGPLDNVKISEGKGHVFPTLARLSQGTYVLDVWALQRGAVLDWASAALVVTDVKYMEAVQPAKEYFGRNERIGGTVKFATFPPKGLSVAVELWDTYDRLVATAKADKKSGAFEFPPISNPLSRAYRLVAQVKAKDFTLDQVETWVGLPSNEVDDYQFGMWANAVKSRSNRRAMRQFKQHAVTAYYDLTVWAPPELMVESADALAQNNLLAYPYCYGAWGFSIAPDRKFEDTVKSYKDQIYPPRVKAYRRYGAMAYSTCEESYIERVKPDAWSNPEVLKDYRAYLKERYDGVAKLNEVWGSKFKNYEEIGPISFVEAKTSRQPTRWMEQELHKVDRFNRLQEATYQTIEEMDPGARVALDCTGGMDFDWPRMAKITRAGTQSPLEVFNRNNGYLAGTWFGYYSYSLDEWSSRIIPWQYLLQGGSHVTWFANAFTLDLSEPLLCMQQASEECRELESGIGKLLLSSRKRVDPILILWSNPSYYAGILNPGEVSWEAARERFDNFLRRVGFDYQTVDTEFIEKSLAFGEQQRVLILPACQAISRKGVEKIKAFAEAGGVVIADFPPAVVDEYLRPYGQTVSAAAVQFETCAKCQGQKRVEVGNVWQACPACGGTGQTMKGGAAPTISLLTNVFDFGAQGAKKVGKGCGLFLKGSPDKREEWGGIRKSLIEKAGVRGDMEVQDPLGNLRTDLRSYVFDNGRAMFLGMLPDRALNNPPGENLTVKLARKCHVYDVRRHQYLGETDTVLTGILPVEAKLLAFLPERIEGLNVALPKATGRPGDVLDLKGAILPMSLKDIRLVVRIEVSKDGKVQEAYTKNLAFQGDFTDPIPLALNQEKGEYRVKVMEIISGYTQEMKFIVK